MIVGSVDLVPKPFILRRLRKKKGKINQYDKSKVRLTSSRTSRAVIPQNQKSVAIKSPTQGLRLGELVKRGARFFPSLTPTKRRGKSWKSSQRREGR